MTKKNKMIAIIVTSVAAAALMTGLIMASVTKTEESVYRETTVQYGKLTVGVTENGTVAVGTSTQTLDLDISAFASESSNGFSWQMAMPDEMNRMGDSSTNTSDDRTLVVESIDVSVGQQVEVGDALLRLTQESVDTIREELVSDVTQAQLLLHQLETEQKSTALSAAHAYETNVTYGEAAQLEYDEALEEANQLYEDALTALEEAQEQFTELQEKVETLTAQYQEESHLYEEAAYLVTYIDREEDPYGYIKAQELRTSALATVEATEDKLEEKKEELTRQETEIASLTRKLTIAEKDQKKAQIQAKSAYDIRVLQYQNASELYTIETELMEEQRQSAQEAYDSAQQKLEEFDNAIFDYAVVSEYAGVITELPVKVGDSLANGTELFVLNDYQDVTVTVSVEDDLMEQIAVGDQVNVYLPAFPDSQFKAVVEEISDATIDSNSTVTYEVTVKIEGDVSAIYEGMSSEVTFITKETKKVIYVSNRAIYRDGTAAYVLVWDEEGNAVRKDVKTGFSDGIYAEITEGLAEGDIVLIESKVGDA